MKGSAKRWVVRPSDTDLGAVLDALGVPRTVLGEGRVFVDRKRVQDARMAMRPGSVVTVGAEAEPSAPVTILAERPDAVAVAKPAGIPTIPDLHGSAHSLVAQVARLLDVDAATLHPSSRLDRDVSGVVTFARNAAGQAWLAQARSSGRYLRRYVAIAVPSPKAAALPDVGTWSAPIGRARDPKLRAARGPEAKEAVSHFAVVVRQNDVALLALAPVTGRTHQLRVHASDAGWPLLGDKAYGGPSRLVLDDGRVLALTRVALHCARVTIDGWDVRCPVDDALLSPWASLGGSPDAWNTAVECSVDGTPPPLTR